MAASPTSQSKLTCDSIEKIGKLITETLAKCKDLLQLPRIDRGELCPHSSDLTKDLNCLIGVLMQLRVETANHYQKDGPRDSGLGSAYMESGGETLKFPQQESAEGRQSIQEMDRLHFQQQTVPKSTHNAQHFFQTKRTGNAVLNLVPNKPASKDRKTLEECVQATGLDYPSESNEGMGKKEKN